jgi:3D (Asp-Asp-Asp) domain-containing protein
MAMDTLSFIIIAKIKIKPKWRRQNRHGKRGENMKMKRYEQEMNAMTAMLLLACLFMFVGLMLFVSEWSNIVVDAPTSVGDAVMTAAKDVRCVPTACVEELVEHTEEAEIEADVAPIQPKEVNPIYLGVFRLTAYCSCEKCCGEYANNRPKDANGEDIVLGSSGARLYQGVSIAVDPRVIAYGSIVKIGGKTYTAHDCGGAIKGNRIDVYFDNHEDAMRFGVQSREVYLIGT